MLGFLTELCPLVQHAWIKQRTGVHWSTDFRSFARVVDNEIIAVVAYEGFTGTSCRMHMAGEGQWINRKMIRHAFNVPFNVWKLKMVFGVVPSGNQNALDIDKRFGFREILVVPGAHPDGALHFLQMTHEDWQRSKFYG